jgi:hypothetical protein
MILSQKKFKMKILAINPTKKKTWNKNRSH